MRSPTTVKQYSLKARKEQAGLLERVKWSNTRSPFQIIKKYFAYTLHGGGRPVTGRHSQGSPFPGCVYEHTMLEYYTGDAVRLKYIVAMLFCWNTCIYGRCCSAWVYNYGRCCSAGIFKGDAGRGNPWEWRPQIIYRGGDMNRRG